jgi:outer membrane receptor protein involved in Fe transport
MHNKNKMWLLCGAAAVAAYATAAPAFAQDTDRDEVVVSARKTAESLQEAPISVSAITAEDISEKGLTSVDDIARFAPGLSFSKAFGRSGDRPVVRGQSNVLANVQFGVESGTAYFVDGIYYPTSIQTLDFNLIKQVEVIRGPQSALYGRNTYAGAINFITVDPSTDGVSGAAHFTGASGEEFRAGGRISFPLMDGKMGALISGSVYEYGGQYTNELTGKKVGQEASWNVTGMLTYAPTDNFKAKARVTYQRDDDGSIPLFLQGSAENNCLPGFRSNFYRSGGALNSGALATSAGALNRNQYFCGEIKPGPVRLNTDAIGPGATQVDGTAFDGIERDLVVAGLNLDWDLTESLTLTSATGYRTETELFGADSDHSDANIFTGPPTLAFTSVREPLFANTNRNDLRDWSQELRMDFKASDRFRIMAGGFFYYQEDRGVEITKLSGVAGLPYGAPSLDVACAGTTQCSDKATVENWAVFGLAEIGITDRLSITGELRYMEETKSLVQFGGNGLQTFPANPSTVRAENTEDYLTPRITLDYQASDDLLLYFVYAEGVKPGGFNGASGVSVGLPTYAPETADSFEAGFKKSMFDGKLTVNASGYFLDASNVQLTTAVPSTSAVNSIATNQGQGEIWGAEIELFYAPNDNWDFSANYAFTNPKFTAGCDQDQWIFTSGGGVFFGENDPRNTSFNSVFGGTATCDITGNRYPLVSKHMASGAATYTAPLSANMDFFMSANASYESSKFVQVHNLAETGDALVLGARAGIRRDGWELNAFVRNLTDEDTIAIATRWFDLRYGGVTGASGAVGAGRIIADGGTLTTVTTGSPRGFFGSLRRPRQFGVEMKYAF